MIDSGTMILIGIVGVVVLGLFVFISTQSIISVLVIFVLGYILYQVFIKLGYLKVDIKDGGLDIGLFEKTPVPAPSVPVMTAKNIQKPEVFYVSGNDYTYDEAAAVCAAYDSELASYDQIQTAYSTGAEWCGYGWSQGGMALFPTQDATWKALQMEANESQRTGCGRPGVNGGYMKNPAVKYGVNCYGYKPKMTPEEEDLMANKSIYPKTKKDIAMEERVAYWKDKLKEIMVSPFNHNSWSKI